MSIYFNNQRRMWHAKLRINGRDIDLKMFPTEMEAQMALDEARTKYKDEPVIHHTLKWFEQESKRQIAELSQQYK